MSEVKIVRRDREAWDADLALTETYNFRRVMELHLKRCDNARTATEIAAILSGVAKGFEQKSLALSSKVG